MHLSKPGPSFKAYRYTTALIKSACHQHLSPAILRSPTMLSSSLMSHSAWIQFEALVLFTLMDLQLPERERLCSLVCEPAVSTLFCGRCTAEWLSKHKHSFHNSSSHLGKEQISIVRAEAPELTCLGFTLLLTV